MTPPLDLAFLGCGEITGVHARLLRRLDRSVRLHFASRDPKKADDVRRRHDGHGAFGSYQEAIDADEVDVVVVATPPALHREQTLSALDAGKSVVVEKPAFVSAEAFEAVASSAEANGRTVYVAENYFYKPLAEHLRRILGERAVGEPLVLRVDAVKRQRAGGWRADPEMAGGGALMEGGVHWVNLMANVGLEVEGVEGYPAGSTEVERRSGVARAEAAPTEESWVVVFRYVGGAVGVLTFSWEVPTALHGVRMSTLYGREGTLRFESNGLISLLTGRRTRPFLPGFRDLSGRRAMWSDFLDSMRSGRPPRMTLETAARDLRWLQRAYGSDAP